MRNKNPYLHKFSYFAKKVSKFHNTKDYCISKTRLWQIEVAK